MRSSTDAARDRRFTTKAAIGTPGASEFRALAGADTAPSANADCRFPRPGANAGVPPRDTGAVGAPGSENGHGQPAEAAGATSANVAREGASRAAAAAPPGGDSPFSPRAPAVPRGAVADAGHDDRVRRGTWQRRIGPS
jgi:hypothetical protein